MRASQRLAAMARVVSPSSAWSKRTETTLISITATSITIVTVASTLFSTAPMVSSGDKTRPSRAHVTGRSVPRSTMVSTVATRKCTKIKKLILGNF